jgi:hypothetical protein
MDGEQVRLDELPQAEYNAARKAGATETISKADLEDIEPPRITGEEKSMKEYREKRDEQQQRSKGSGTLSPKAEKRIGQLTREKYEERERAERAERRLQELERRNGEAANERGQDNGDSNGTEPVSEESESYSAQPEQSETPPEPKIAALRQHYGDWDQVMTRAKNENIRISDDAAKVLRSVENAGHISYLLVKNDELRTEFNKLPPERQVEEIRKIDRDIGDIHSGRKPFAQKVEAVFSPEEISEVVKAAQKNQLGERIVLTLVRELNELPNGPQVMKHLIMNPEASQRLAAMSQERASLELGRISERLEGRNGGFVSKSAPPIKPVSGGNTRSSVPMDEMDMASYIKARAAGRTR